MIETETSKQKFRVIRTGSRQYVRSVDDVELEGTLSSLAQERDVMTSITAKWDDVVELMMPIVIPMQEKIHFLELQVTGLTKELNVLREKKAQKNIQQLEEQSKKTANELRKMFNLQETDSEDKEISLSSLKGMFKEYGNEKTDSVELLRSMRDEEN